MKNRLKGGLAIAVGIVIWVIAIGGIIKVIGPIGPPPHWNSEDWNCLELNELNTKEEFLHWIAGQNIPEGSFVMACIWERILKLEERL